MRSHLLFAGLLFVQLSWALNVAPRVPMQRSEVPVGQQQIQNQQNSQQFQQPQQQQISDGLRQDSNFEQPVEVDPQVPQPVEVDPQVPQSIQVDPQVPGSTPVDPAGSSSNQGCLAVNCPPCDWFETETTNHQGQKRCLPNPGVCKGTPFFQPGQCFSPACQNWQSRCPKARLCRQDACNPCITRFYDGFLNEICVGM